MSQSGPDQPMAENLQREHGEPRHHPVDNDTRRTIEAGERRAKCQIQQREEKL